MSYTVSHALRLAKADPWGSQKGAPTVYSAELHTIQEVSRQQSLCPLVTHLKWDILDLPVARDSTWGDSNFGGNRSYRINQNYIPQNHMHSDSNQIVITLTSPNECKLFIAPTTCWWSFPSS